MFTESRKQTIKLVVAISIICLILITVGILMIKYEVEGELICHSNYQKLL